MVSDHVRPATGRGACGPEVAGESLSVAPRLLGVLEEDKRFFTVFSDGRKVPFIAGGSVDEIDLTGIPLLLKPSHAFQMISCGRTRGFELMKNGELEVIYIGPRQPRIPRQSLVDYVERLRSQSNQQREEPA